MTVTFDFDETLTKSNFNTSYSLWVSTLEPNERVIEKYKQHILNNDQIYIVTFRNEEYVNEVIEFLVANNLNYCKIFATGGKPKKPIIVDILNSSIHYDDDIYTCISLVGTSCTPVLIKTANNANNSSIDLIHEKL